ncbi:MAG TPA: hypothetical protein VGB77_20965 [Abditibacteriaceae bacterium]|jgi:hypothetical protein
MNASYRPLQMPSIGGRGLRRQRERNALLFVLGALLLVLIFLVSRPRIAPAPIADLQKNGVHGVYNLHAKNAELLLYNFRSIEKGKIFRCSRFPHNHRGKLNGKMGLYAAAYFHGEAFDFLRAHNIRTVFLTESKDESYALKGYFQSQAQRTGYRIRLIHHEVSPKSAYTRDERAGKSALRHESAGRSALRQAVQFIQFMKAPDKERDKGAVLLMGDAGKDGVGVIAAAYELWRNTGSASNNELWTQVKERYLVSDVLIGRDKEASKFSSRANCKHPKHNFVCPQSIENLRTDLERIAQVD